jgi:uncharacterized protein YuzE
MGKASNLLIAECLAIAADALELHAKRVWLDYDDEADVLYVSFRKPQRATKTTETDDGVLIRRAGKKVVGLTILNASSR